MASWRDLDNLQVEIEKQSLYILDHSLGDERVIPIIQEIRQATTRYRIPIMVISASPRSEDVMRLFKQDIDDYYLKPLDSSVLYARVKRLLNLFPVPAEPHYPDTIQLDLNRLINFEIARARRGNYPFSIIQLSLDMDQVKPDMRHDSQELMNLCYDSLQPLFRETDMLIGAEDRLVVLCPFADRMGTRVVMSKMVENLSQHQDEYPFSLLEMSYATYPYDGRDKGGLLTYASANKNPWKGW
jgi:DNA-binding response OmpR family regulator